MINPPNHGPSQTGIRTDSCALPSLHCEKWHNAIILAKPLGKCFSLSPAIPAPSACGTVAKNRGVRHSNWSAARDHCLALCGRSGDDLSYFPLLQPADCFNRLMSMVLYAPPRSPKLNCGAVPQNDSTQLIKRAFLSSPRDLTEESRFMHSTIWSRHSQGALTGRSRRPDDRF